MNKQSGEISARMKRVVLPQRPNFESRLEERNLSYADEPGVEWSECEEDAYWGDEGAIEITAEAELQLMEATQEMHNLCLLVVDKVVKDPNLLRMFHIPSDLWPAIRKSWGIHTRWFDDGSDLGKIIYSEYDKDLKYYPKQFDFLGRFDWSWDGVDPPKLLEYNADTPSLLLESGGVSRDWFKDRFEEGDSQTTTNNRRL